MANLKFSANAWEDYLYWQAHDKRVLKRIHGLIQECSRTPTEGMGKPEALRGNLSGWLSRRITASDHMTYRMDSCAETLLIAQLRYHYDD